jgi:hypothetical protein
MPTPASLCESFLDHHVVEKEVAVPSSWHALAQAIRSPISTRVEKGITPAREPVERIVAATRQKPADACLRLRPVQEDQAGHVERDQHECGRGAYTLSMPRRRSTRG